MSYNKNKWNTFINEMPHHSLPFSKKNWGDPRHSLCSYQGKLKPAIAHHLVKIFSPRRGLVFDPFSGVGTIPFEAALNNRRAIGMDISPMAFYISNAKLHLVKEDDCLEIVDLLENFMLGERVSQRDVSKFGNFGYNKTLADYYERKTFQEILLARNYFILNQPQSPEECFVISCLLHILHGNRPYALSRKSHPIVPYAPSGDFIYKSLIEKLKEKIKRSLKEDYPPNYMEGEVYLQDSTETWPDTINNLDAVITSPPFFDSTKFYMANWIRLWFCGWDVKKFKKEPLKYIDEKQKTDFTVYEKIFCQAKERMKKNGVFVMHLGKSEKCDMANILKTIARPWFKKSEIFSENVSHCEKFGIADLGSVTDHEYLILQ